MFTPDFYPTPYDVIETMLNGISIEGKTFLEPSAGKGNIVDYLKKHNAGNILACENNEDLRKILATKCNVIEPDFLKVESHQVSHVDIIVMNPPFASDERHINHAFEIAPPGCTIIALCNAATLDKTYTSYRRKLKQTIEENGSYQNLGQCFGTSERKTNVEISLITLKKPGGNYQQEFEGFMMEEEPEQMQVNGLMPYNFVRDVVNRYIAAVKVFDEQLEAAVKMNNLTSGFYSSKFAVSVTEEAKPINRAEFKKDLQKSGWNFIFNKMNMAKHTTKGLKEDINKFVEQQQQIPFTMKNIYRMVEIVVGTQAQRMDKAILEVFDRLTTHYHDNRYNVEGWKTNSHYLMGQKFILPCMTDIDYSGSGGMRLTHRDHYTSLVEDMIKALCFITGQNYDNHESLWAFLNNKLIEGTEKQYPRKYVKYEWNTWYDWGFFQIKGFKKGTIHFKFKDQEVWALFNQRVAKLKGYALFEPKNYKKAA